MERTQEPREEAGSQGDPAMIPHVTPKKQQERLTEYLK
jgi:hypothetical protein